MRDWVAALSGAGACFALSPVKASDGDDYLMAAMVIVLLVVSLAAHEAAHAWAALKCGDPTARDLGRLTLNPIVHIDPWMTVLLPALLYVGSRGQVMFGGAKPVPVQFHRLRHPLRDMSFVALAGPLTNLLIALLLVCGFYFFAQYGWYNGAAATPSARASQLLPRVLAKSAEMNVLLFVFNLVPIPPLDGSRVLTWLLPSNLRDSYVALERWGMLIIFGLLWFSPLGGYLWETVDSLFDLIDRLVRLGFSP